MNDFEWMNETVLYQSSIIPNNWRKTRFSTIDVAWIAYSTVHYKLFICFLVALSLLLEAIVLNFTWDLKPCKDIHSHHHEPKCISTLWACANFYFKHTSSIMHFFIYFLPMKFSKTHIDNGACIWLWKYLIGCVTLKVVQCAIFNMRSNT